VQGDHSNNCGQAATDVADNIANSGGARNDYFAAIPGDQNGGFTNVVHCGECARITNGGNSIIVTIIDECPTNGQNAPCKNTGHLDLSMQAFNALGYSTGDPSNTTWKTVPCPVTGNIKAVYNTDQNGQPVPGQIYFQNTVFPVTAAAGPNVSHDPSGFWNFPSVSGGSFTTNLTDAVGDTLNNVVIPDGGGDLGVQFPSPAGTCQ
jgi:hypothetical protein